MRGIAVLLAACVAGCGVNPIPEPPAAPELGDVSGDLCMACDTWTVDLAGGPGSARNADEVWVVSLDKTAPPAVAEVGADGSFALQVEADLGDEVRVQARRGEQRSAPADLVVAQGVLERAPRPLSDCFDVAPELELPDTAAGEVSAAVLRLEHGCAEPLVIDAIALRAPSADVGVEDVSAPVVLAPGEPRDVRVELRSSAPGLREEVLLIEVSSPAATRRAVTLFGRGVP
ncbi:hypothetical protein [Sorangium cellulosum]|uniref:Abnormal spindle-like microcephaly-associated protein ASH domain-containing protein n=1 Tax=Sorangium cellulosum TaxID=56 RepID=A0A150QTB6_SORCE|nr:hypothetical protein [Sorangium cellulosum]KYF71267.1 hypothetical protein BE15_41775 [Sorangium cellulosum]